MSIALAFSFSCFLLKSCPVPLAIHSLQSPVKTMTPPMRRKGRIKCHLEDIPVIEPRSRADFRKWLTKAWQSEEGRWAIYTKKSAVASTLTYVDIVEECLCFGWIDGTAGKVDSERSKVYIRPRLPNSGWSSVNKERIKKLEAQGLLHPAGIECIASAKERGTWNRFDAAEALTVPAELQQELDKYPRAATNFAAFPNSAKKAMLHWLFDAKRPETRARRIAEITEAAEANRRAR
jgi:uncharacterized protein YdeI (YjbR/CyaY-like superfamily)